MLQENGAVKPDTRTPKQREDDRMKLIQDSPVRIGQNTHQAPPSLGAVQNAQRTDGHGYHPSPPTR